MSPAHAHSCTARPQNRPRLLLSLAAALWASGAAFADTIFLKDGGEVDGEIVAESRVALVVRIKETGQLRSIRRADIDIIIFEKRAQSAEGRPLIRGMGFQKTATETEKTLEERVADAAHAPKGAGSEGAEEKVKTEPAEPGSKPDPDPAAPKTDGPPTAGPGTGAQEPEAEGAKSGTEPEQAEGPGETGESKEPGTAAEGEKGGTEGERKESEGAKKDGEGEQKAVEEGEVRKTESAPPGKEGAEPGAEKKAESPKGESPAGQPSGSGEGQEARPAAGAEGESGTTAGEGKPLPEEKTEKTEKKDPWPKLAPELQALFDKQLDKLESQDPAERSEAKDLLRAKGKELIPALAKGLQHKGVNVRSTCADLLGDLSARNAIKYLIEVFYAVMPDKGQTATYQRTFVRSLRVALEKTTGQSFISVEPSSPLVQEGLAKYIAWYNQNYDRLPPQVGEPEVDPTAPDYMDLLKKARELKLERKTWPRPPLSADLATGGEAKAPPGSTERKPDEEYRDRFPKADRSTAGGYFRESDRDYGGDFFKK